MCGAFGIPRNGETDCLYVSWALPGSVSIKKIGGNSKKGMVGGESSGGGRGHGGGGTACELSMEMMKNPDQSRWRSIGSIVGVSLEKKWLGGWCGSLGALFI